LITNLRNLTGEPDDQGTTAQDLKSALWHISQIQIYADDTKLPNTMSIGDAVQEITNETHAGNPVIAFVDGTQLIPKRSYTGHWIVITGIVGQTVYINDPDNYPAAPGKEIQTSQLPLSVYEAAATTSTAKSLSNVYGLVITGEDFQSA
jgi:hypothetical protein